MSPLQNRSSDLRRNATRIVTDRIAESEKISWLNENRHCQMFPIDVLLLRQALEVLGLKGSYRFTP